MRGNESAGQWKLKMDEAKHFLAAVNGSPGLWKSIDVRAVAAKVDGSWHNILTRCYLEHKRPSQVARFKSLPVLNHIGCWQEVLPVRSLARLVRDLEKGFLRVGDQKVILEHDLFAQRPSQPYGRGYYNLWDRSKFYHRAIRGWSSHAFSAQGDSIFGILNHVAATRDEIDHDLRACAVPFDGLEGVARDVLELRDDLTNRVATFELFAPLGARFITDDCRLANRQANLRILIEEPEIAQFIRLTFVRRERGKLPVSGTIDLARARQTPSTRGNVLDVNRTFKSSMDELSLMLMVGDCCADRIVLTDILTSTENVRLAAYGVFDKSLTVFNKIIAGNKSTSQKYAPEFEQAVGRLFTFLGFRVDILGTTKGLNAAVDMIAYGDPRPVVLVVECTTGGLNDRGKLDKLVRRSREVKAVVGSHQVMPVIVTSRDRSAIGDGAFEQAREEMVCVLAKGDLSDLFEMASANKEISEVLDFLGSCVPEKSKMVLSSPIPSVRKMRHRRSAKSR